MKEHPILFSAPMVRAILDGSKTQTRRVVKPQPYIANTAADGMRFWNVSGVVGGRIMLEPDFFASCPYGQPGDRLWVREAHALEHEVDGNEPPHADGRPVLRRPADDVEGMLPGWTQPHYRATDPAPDLCCERTNCAQCRDQDMGPHWRPSIHMPRWASRITLEVTGVRVERLRTISEADAIAEGIHVVKIGSGYPDRYSPTPVAWADVIEQQAEAYEDPCMAYQDLWESINGAGSWDANPWVWVVEFKPLKTATNGRESGEGPCARA